MENADKEFSHDSFKLVDIKTGERTIFEDEAKAIEKGKQDISNNGGGEQLWR